MVSRRRVTKKKAVVQRPVPKNASHQPAPEQLEDSHEFAAMPKSERLLLNGARNSKTLGQPAAISPNMILRLQHHIGNQAVQRLLAKQGQLPTRSAPNGVIQRLSTAQAYKETVPSVKGFGVRKQIIAAVKKYHSYMRSYPKNFPKKDFYAVNAYYEEGRKRLSDQIEELVPAMQLLFDAMKNLIKERAIEKEDPIYKGAQFISLELRELKHRTRLDDFETMHHDLMLQAAAKNPQFQFLTMQDMVGEEQEGPEGGINQLGEATFNTPVGEKTGFTKEDKGQLSDPGIGIGLTKGTVKPSLRSVATFEVSDLMGLGIIPYTSLTKQEDETGREKVGQFMEKAHGTTGQGKVTGDEIPPVEVERVSELLAQLKNLQTSVSEKRQIKKEIEETLRTDEGFTEINGKLYKLQTVVTDINWENPVLQQQLNTLQFFDLLVAHADRHAGNYIIDADPNDREKITGVKGIDNDDAWGPEFNSTDFGKRGKMTDKSKTPNLPPVVDMLTAIRFLKTEWESIQAILEKYAMSEKEIAAAANRFYAIEDHIIKLAQAGKIATLSGKADISDLIALQQALKVRHGITIDLQNYPLMQWGEETAKLLNEDNSYSGKQKSFKEQKVKEGKELYQPEWK